MRVRSPRSLFGIACLSSAVGLLMYWVMFMNVLPRLMRPEASITLPIISGVIGTASCALLYFGISNLVASVRSKPKAGGTLVLRRDKGGRVVSIGWAEATYVPKARKHGKAKYVVFAVLATLFLGGYTSTMVLTGYTLQDVMRGVYSPFMVVSSQSMQPALNYGDLIIVRKEPVERIAVGDIIAFTTPSWVAQSPIIHRVVDKWTENGKICFKTRGRQQHV